MEIILIVLNRSVFGGFRIIFLSQEVIGKIKSFICWLKLPLSTFELGGRCYCSCNDSNSEAASDEVCGCSVILPFKENAKTTICINRIIDDSGLFEFTEALAFVQHNVVNIVRHCYILCFREIFRLRITQYASYRIGRVRILEMPCPADFTGAEAYLGEVGSIDCPIAKFVDRLRGES